MLDILQAISKIFIDSVFEFFFKLHRDQIDDKSQATSHYLN